MSDKRNMRKQPSDLRINHRTSLGISQGNSPAELVACLRKKGDPGIAVFTRAEARKVRDWLNHYIEFTAENDARVEWADRHRGEN